MKFSQLTEKLKVMMAENLNEKDLPEELVNDMIHGFLCFDIFQSNQSAWDNDQKYVSSVPSDSAGGS